MSGHLLLLAVIFAIVIFALELSLELGVAVTIAYITVVWCTFAAGSRRGVWAAALICSLLTVVGCVLSPAGGEIWKVLLNRGLTLLTLWITAMLCLRLLRLLSTLTARTQAAESLKQEAVRKQQDDLRRSRAMASMLEDLSHERERLQAELAARAEYEEAQARLAAIVASSDDAIIGKTLDGTVPSWNRGAELLYGYTAEEVIGHSITAIVPNERADEVEKFLARLRRGESVDQWETICLHKDGTLRNVSLTISPIRDAQGVVVGVSTIARDISERLQLLEDLRNSEHFARGMLDSLVCIAGVCTLDGVLVEANQPALLAGGVAAQDVLGRRLEDTYWWSHDAEMQTQLREAMARARKGQVVRYDTVIRVADEQRITVDFQLVPLTNEDGEITHLVMSAFNVTDRVNYEQQLQHAKELAEQANAAKSQFLASMSHELRTPLNGVLGMTELLTGTDLTERQQQYVEACRNSGESLLSLINDVLDLSKIEAGRLDLDCHDFDLETLVTDTVDTMSWRAADKQLEMPCYIADVSRFILKGDSNRLRQVLVNLLGNAIKFTDAGEIVLRTEIVDRREQQVTVRFAVSDTGIGIHGYRAL